MTIMRTTAMATNIAITGPRANQFHGCFTTIIMIPAIVRRRRKISKIHSQTFLWLNKHKFYSLLWRSSKPLIALS